MRIYLALATSAVTLSAHFSAFEARAQTSAPTKFQRDSIANADSSFWSNYRTELQTTQRFASVDSQLLVLASTWLSSPVLFAPGTSHVQGEAVEALRFKSQLLRQNPALRITLTGYSDTTGALAINAGLAAARAQDVRRFLLSAGASPSQVAIAYQEVPEDSFALDPALARRVDFAVNSKSALIWSDRTGKALGAASVPVVFDLADASTEFLPVRLYYATDRKPENALAGTINYGVERLDTLVFGRATVTVPNIHSRGRIESRGFFDWLLQRNSRDRRRYFVLDSTAELSSGTWHNELKQAVVRSARPEVYVFVHGFNVSFRDAAFRAAQATVDLQLRSVPVLYSWPSFAGTLKYVGDLDASEYSAPHLARFIRSVAEQTGATRVHILAHSMGARALLRAVRELRGTEAAKLGQVILAAPDEDQQSAAPVIPDLVGLASRVTLYASDRDRALQVSQNVLRDGRPRLGQAGKSLRLFPGVETIDVSAVDTDFLSHSYFGNSLQVLDDLRLLVNLGSSAADRLTNLRRLPGGGAYWHLPPR